MPLLNAREAFTIRNRADNSFPTNTHSTARNLAKIVEDLLSASKGNILIADDDADLRATITEMLCDEGYFVVQAQDGAEAISLLRLVRYNLIILDLSMPRVDGAQVVKMIRDLTMRTPIVIMSGYRDAPHHAVKLDIEAYLPKPFEFPVLLSVVEDCMKKAQTPDKKLSLPALPA